MYGTFLTTLTGTNIFLRKKSSELVNFKANKREGSGRYKLKTTSYLKAEHTYEAESADHAVQLRPWFCSVFPSDTNVNFALLYLIAPIHHQCFLCS